MYQTQINIYNGRKQFRYGVEYVDNPENVRALQFEYLASIDQDLSTDIFQFARVSDDDIDVKRRTNNWSVIDNSDLVSTGLPSSINLSSVNVYFPTYSVETYTGNWFYVFSAYTYINGDKIILSEVLLDRRNAKAYPGKKVMHNIRYSEYINVVFPDPWEITYSDDWESFRQDICGEPENMNNTGSLLTIEIHPVKITDNGEILKLDNYLGGMNSMILSDNRNTTLSTTISYSEPSTITLDFNLDEIYNNDLDEYISETYELGEDIQVELNSTLTLFDNENIYNIYLPTTTVTTPRTQHIFNIYPNLNDQYSTIKFRSWEEFKPGLQFKVVTEVIVDEEPMIDLISNSLCMTQDMFATIMENTASYDLTSLNNALNADTNIESYFMSPFNIVNKTEKKVINIERPNDFKNNLTRPVFIRTQKNNTITVHPQATENIALNLREYKNYVESFTLRIANVDFPEFGRQGSNVVFKVVGKQLPEEIEAGTYYVLDDNNELVTTGDYVLE